MKAHCRTPQLDSLIFGGGGIGCLYREVPEEEAEKTIKAALQVGIKYFDTAPLYGAGLSEERFGKYLPKDVTISTKCGRIVKSRSDVTAEDSKADITNYADVWGTQKYHDDLPVRDYSREGVVKSVRQSKDRLKRNVIQNLRLHDAETEEFYAQATAPGAAVDTMIELKKNGEVLELSLGSNKADYILRFVEKYPEGTFDNVMVAGSWNLIDQDAYDLFVACEEKNIKVFNVGIFASGCIFGGAHYKYGPIPTIVDEKLNKWRDLCRKHEIDISVVALNFAFLPDVVERVAIGMGREEEVRINKALFGKSVPKELWDDAKAQGLIRPDINLS